MKIFRFVIFTICMFMFCVSYAFANESTVNVNLSDKKEIAPNAIMINFAIETTNSNVDNAILENRKKADLLYSTLKTLIQTNRGDYIKTASYTVNPNYDYNKGKSDIKNYTVTNAVTVYSKDINLVSNLIDSAMNKGVTRINNLSYSSTSYENECRALLEDLSRKAIARANSALKPMNSKVSSVKNLSTSCSESSNVKTNYYVRTMSATPASDSAVKSTPVEAGNIYINANVSGTFYVEKIK